MRGSRHRKIIWIGPLSENISLGVISVVANFHAFIINLNNSVFFLVDNSWTTRGGTSTMFSLYHYFILFIYFFIFCYPRYSLVAAKIISVTNTE